MKNKLLLPQRNTQNYLNSYEVMNHNLY